MKAQQHILVEVGASCLITSETIYYQQQSLFRKIEELQEVEGVDAKKKINE